MKVKGVNFEDFINYKIPSMYIAMPTCSFKCDKECGRAICQNSSLTKEPTIMINKNDLIEAYVQNPITKAIVFGGLEPFDSELDLIPFIDTLRRQYECNDPVIIYTGYTENELDKGMWGTPNISSEQHQSYWKQIKDYKNIVVKFGRFIPNQNGYFNDILGVTLASSNQYAKEFM